MPPRWWNISTNISNEQRYSYGGKYQDYTAYGRGSFGHSPRKNPQWRCPTGKMLRIFRGPTEKQRYHGARCSKPPWRNDGHFGSLQSSRCHRQRWDHPSCGGLCAERQNHVVHRAYCLGTRQWLSNCGVFRRNQVEPLETDLGAFGERLDKVKFIGQECLQDSQRPYRGWGRGHHRASEYDKQAYDIDSYLEALRPHQASERDIWDGRFQAGYGWRDGADHWWWGWPSLAQ